MYGIKKQQLAVICSAKVILPMVTFMCLLHPLSCFIQPSNSVSLTVEEEISLLGLHCPGTVRLTCKGVELTVLRWRYNVDNDIFTFSTLDSPTNITLTGHPAFLSASLDAVALLPSDPRFANFTSTLTIDLEQLQSVTDIVCGDPGNFVSLPVDIILLQPTIPATPRITSVIANYLQSTMLSSLEVSWGKLKALCPQFEATIIYQISIGATMYQNISQTSCGQRLCTAVVNTTGRELTEISLRAVNEAGASGTDSYPMIEQMSGQYYTPQVNISDSCVATARCVSGSGPVNGCFVQYASDPTYMDLSDPLTGPLNINIMFDVQPLQQPNTVYYFVFSVMVDDTLAVKIYTEEISPECTTQSTTTQSVDLIIVIALFMFIEIVLVLIVIAIAAYRKVRSQKKHIQGHQQVELVEMEITETSTRANEVLVEYRHVSTQTYVSGDLRRSAAETSKAAAELMRGTFQFTFTRKPSAQSKALHGKEEDLVEHWPAEPKVYHVPVGQKELFSRPCGINSSTQTENHDRRFSLYHTLQKFPVLMQENAENTDIIWRGRESLFVYFMDSVGRDGNVIKDFMCIKDWKCRGQPMSVNTVMAWARVWNVPGFPQIPYLEVTERLSIADIRLRFSNTGYSWSKLGTDAVAVAITKPTMVLNLNGHSAAQMESIVVHMFGTALGLEKEHQRPDFWNALEKYLDLQMMKKDPLVNPHGESEGGAAFRSDWYCKPLRRKTSLPYDPTSIMHYWFDVEWIKHSTLRTCANIDKEITVEQDKMYLKGLHKRFKFSSRGGLVKKPSISDYNKLVTAYGGNFASATSHLEYPIGALSGTVVVGEKIWRGRKSLFVHFMDSMDRDGKVMKDFMCIEDWKCRGQPMSVNTVMAWARVWKVPGFSQVPCLEVTEKPNRADIRVRFSEIGDNWSVVGIEAKTITNLKKPTMVLNLKGYTAEQMESIVVHEFGHALGLEHEHQRSDFWGVVQKYLDTKEMNAYTFTSVGDVCEKDWFKTAGGTTGGEVNTVPYDPASIMHAWFDIKWMKDASLRSYGNIDTKITIEPDRTYLKGLLGRFSKAGLPKKPSINDYRTLVTAYGGEFDSSSGFNAVLKTETPADEETELQEDKHLWWIVDAVWECRAQWRHLGVELDLTAGTLDVIYHDNRDLGDMLITVVDKWLSSGKATIHQLIRALESSTVRRPDLAENIKSEFKDGETQLCVNEHLWGVVSRVWDCRASWRAIGEQLDLTAGSLDAIYEDKRDVGDMLIAVVRRWLSLSKATIHQLINALESPTVRRPDLAEKIREKLL